MNYKGAIDNRSVKEKSKDFHWEEFNVLGPVTYPERASVGYTLRNQDGSGSCVAQTVAKMLEVWDFNNDNTPTIYSATPIYQRRRNKPAPGMVGVDALQYAVDGHIYLESDVPSQLMNDDAMDKVSIKDTLKKPEKPLSYSVLPINFDAVAQEVQKSHVAMVWFKCGASEWSTTVPEGRSSSEAIRHSVAAVDCIHYDGEDYIIIEDSWGKLEKNSDIPIQEGQRAISRTFFEDHCFFAASFTNFKFDGGSKPKHYWNYAMKYGQHSEDIVKLQEVLKYEKFFPSNQECTGYFGGITARALVKWQIKHGMPDFANEKDMRKVMAGKKTLAELNKLYN